MSTTTESAISEATTKEGIEIKGKDVIKLNAPEILPPEGMLLTEAQDLVGAINELKKGLDEGGGDDSDEWVRPSDWIDIPDPEDNQIVMLMDCRRYRVAPMIGLWCDGLYAGVTVDCGDGQVITIPEDNSVPLVYTYSSTGQYIMTVTSDYIKGIDLSTPAYNGGCRYTLRAIKFGANMHAASGNLSSQYGLVYAEFFGEAATYFAIDYNLECVKAHVPLTETEAGCFKQCYNLKYLEGYTDELTTVPNSCFYDCGLEKIILPKATVFDTTTSCISYCRNLKEVYAPLVTSITSGEFASCQALREFTLADGYNANGNTFADNYLLSI